MIKRPERLDPRKKEQTEPLWRLVYALVCLAIIFLIGLMLVTGRYLNVEVVGSSMEDTIADGAELYAERYRGNLQHGDIIVIDVSDVHHFQSRGTTYIIKRLIGMEGDKIRLADGKVYITYAGTDREICLDEPYAQGETNARPHFSDGEFHYEWTLKEGEIFVLGDNRPASDDSRIIGPLQRENVIGVVLDWNFVEPQGWEIISAPFIRLYLNIVRFFS